jgi:hypothetical protein
MRQNTRSRTRLAGLLRNSGRDRCVRAHFGVGPQRTDANDCRHEPGLQNGDMDRDESAACGLCICVVGLQEA